MTNKELQKRNNELVKENGNWLQEVKVLKAEKIALELKVKYLKNIKTAHEDEAKETHKNITRMADVIVHMSITIATDRVKNVTDEDIEIVGKK